jgi:transposase
VVDERGLPLRLLLSPGQASDKAIAQALLGGLPTAQAVIGDRGYDWKYLIEFIALRGGQAHIPTRRDRKTQRSVDPALYRKRNLIGRFFNKLKYFRRVATRFDKLARNFLAAVALASIRIWSRTYESTT